MKAFYAILLTLGLMGTAAFAQPTITQVSNAASESLFPLPNSSIAQGSFFAIYGSGFGVDSSTCATNYYNCYWKPYPLQTSLQGTSVSVTIGSNPAVAAYIEYAAHGSTTAQINAVLPSSTPTGTGTLTVTSNGATSAAFPIVVVKNSFGTFTWNGGGSGPGIMTNAVSNLLFLPFPTGSYRPAKPGDYVTIWGTGLGPVDPTTEATAPPTQTNLCATASSCPVTVWVGGVQANVPYAGRSGFTAVDQIDFVVPSSAQGCFVQVAVQYGSVISNFTSLAVDPNGAACQDDDGINLNDIMTAVTNNGKANVAAISVLSNYLTLTVPALGPPLQWDNDTVNPLIGTFSTGVLEQFQGFALAPSVSNCSVSPFLQYPPPVDPALGGVAFLDVGAPTFKGPNGTASVPKTKSGNSYGGLVGGETIGELILGCPSGPTGCTPFVLNATGWGTSSWTYSILPGTFTVSAPGGANVSAFSGSYTVSSAAAGFKWTNQSAIGTSISRSSPLTVTWTGGDTDGFVDITLISSTLASGEFPATNTPGILAECIAPASTGTFTVPTYVLQSLPSTAGSTALVPPGELLVGPASKPVSITPAPTGLDAAYLFYHYIAGTNVTWQ